MNGWQKDWSVVNSLKPSGQGETYIVSKKNGSAGTRYILKVLKKDKMRDQDARTRMFQEVSNLQILNSKGANVPAVVSENVLEQFKKDGEELYFVMEFIEGKTLNKWISEDGPLSLEVAVPLILKLCETVRLVFIAGIVHRDLKPDNLMVGSIEPPKITMLDFGLSYRSGQNEHPTGTGETMGNSFLILPELRVVHGNKRDSRSDLTNLNAIFFYSVVGIAPGVLRDSNNKAPHENHMSRLQQVAGNPAKLHFLKHFLIRAFSPNLNTGIKLWNRLSNL